MQPSRDNECAADEGRLGTQLETSPNSTHSTAVLSARDQQGAFPVMARPWKTTIDFTVIWSRRLFCCEKLNPEKIRNPSGATDWLAHCDFKDLLHGSRRHLDCFPLGSKDRSNHLKFILKREGWVVSMWHQRQNITLDIHAKTWGKGLGKKKTWIWIEKKKMLCYVRLIPKKKLYSKIQLMNHGLVLGHTNNFHAWCACVLVTERVLGILKHTHTHTQPRANCTFVSTTKLAKSNK